MATWTGETTPPPITWYVELPDGDWMLCVYSERRIIYRILRSQISTTISCG